MSNETKKSQHALLHLAVAGFCIGMLCVSAAPAAIISFDENGNGIGTIGAGVLATDPGPGGRSSVLTYTLPFTVNRGDVLVNDPGFGILDVIRFNGSTVVFYSDNIDGF